MINESDNLIGEINCDTYSILDSPIGLCRLDRVNHCKTHTLQKRNKLPSVC